MIRWSEAYKARGIGRDNVDSIDNVPPPPGESSQTVNRVNIVTVLPALDGDAIEAAFEATERAAIIAEGNHGNPAALVPHTLPSSWADPKIIPTSGARCFCCREARWWREAAEPNGWRCVTCHPPAHHSYNGTLEVST
jgi:hypothetical protein